MSNSPADLPPADRNQVEAWLDAARRGSGEAFGRLLDTFRRYLLLVAHRELDPDLQAKGGPSDLVQETFLNAQKNFAQFRGQTEREFLAWLHGILKNSANDFQRRFLQTGKRQIGREVVSPESSSGAFGGSFPAPVPTPSREVVAREEAALLEEALERLPESYRQVIRWRYAEGRSFAEIGEQLNRSADAARMLWLRAFKQLQKEMGPAHDSP
jgi:RNA polymerase sigma-70 factor (ECF subfamily)